MKSGNTKNPRSNAQRKASGFRWKSRLLDAAILVSTVVVGVFVFSVAGRLSSTHAERNDRPPRVLRTQILNGCGESGLAAVFGDQLAGLAIEEFRFDVVDRDNFDNFKVERSFIIAYTLPPEDALRLARALGLSENDVSMMERTDNPWGLDISIVLGRTVRPVTTPAGTAVDTP
jgi:hypothetical protein